jgi:hypothetical protein
MPTFSITTDSIIALSVIINLKDTHHNYITTTFTKTINKT